MIYPSLNTIAEQLNAGIYQKWGKTINGTSEIVQLSNIAAINEDKNDLQNKIIITLIKIEEETTLKNSAFLTKKSTEETKKHNPPIFLNLYILISITKTNYKEALQLLSDTILFFQTHSVFSDKLPGSELKEEALFRVTVELYDIKFQEVFDMWSNLGSKQFPSVIYKVRLLEFFDAEDAQEAPVIKKIHVKYDRVK